MFSDHPRSCRRLGQALGFDKMTIWRWRQKIIRALGGSGASQLGGVVEADEKFFRESRKGSREWVRHQRDPINHPKPDRMRWVDCKLTGTHMPAGISKYQIPVLTIADRSGSKRADVLPDHTAPPLMAILARCRRDDADPCSDRDPACDFFAKQAGLPHCRIDAKKGPFVIDKALSTSRPSIASTTASSASWSHSADRQPGTCPDTPRGLSLDPFAPSRSASMTPGID
jgi:hypothetical protein